MLAIHAPALSQAVPAMGVDDAILGQVPQPHVERHVRRLQVLFEPLIRFDHDILNDVRRIDATGEYRIEPQVNHPPQRFAEFAEEAIHGPGFTLSGLFEHFIGDFAVWPHDDIV